MVRFIARVRVRLGLIKRSGILASQEVAFFLLQKPGLALGLALCLEPEGIADSIRCGGNDWSLFLSDSECVGKIYAACKSLAHAHRSMSHHIRVTKFLLSWRNGQVCPLFEIQSVVRDL